MDRKRLLVMLPLLSIFLLLLGGLYFTAGNQIDDQGIRLKRIEEVAQFEDLNTRLIPDFKQMVADLVSQGQIDKDQVYYQGQDTYYLDYPDYRMTVERMAIYQKVAPDGEVAGALVLLATSLTNRTDHSVRVPLEQLVLYTANQKTPVDDSLSFLTVESGNLLQLMRYSANQIPAKASVEGYLIFELSPTAWLKARQVNQLVLTNVSSEQANPRMLQKFHSQLLGGLVLPLNQQTASDLKQRQTQLGDVLTSYQVATKQVMADQWPNLKLMAQGLSLQVNRIELTDIKLSPVSADLLGQSRGQWACLSISYELTNQSNYTLAIADNQFSVIDSRGNIYDNSIRIYYPRPLYPGQRQQITESLLIRPYLLSSNWQDQALQLQFNCLGYHSRIGDNEWQERIQVSGPLGVQPVAMRDQVFNLAFEWKAPQELFYLSDFSLADKGTWQAEQKRLLDQEDQQIDRIQ